MQIIGLVFRDIAITGQFDASRRMVERPRKFGTRSSQSRPAGEERGCETCLNFRKLR